MWKHSIAIAGLAALCLACGGGEKAGGNSAAKAEARKAEWTWLENSRKQLQEMRAQAVTLAASPETATQVEAVQQQIDTKTDELGRRLVQYINDDPPLQGEPMKPEQLAAFRLKSAEDMVVAAEFIDKGGDYRRAIDIYKAALSVDPDNPELKAALEKADTMRLVTPERFALVKKGMTEDEVRQVLGQVYLRNVKDYPEKHIVSWFFPTADDGHAAAVYFSKKGDKVQVYQATFDAVKPGGGGAEEPK